MVKEKAKLSRHSPETLDEVIQEVALIIASTLDINDVYEGFALKVKDLVDFDRIYINVLDPDTGYHSINYMFGLLPADLRLGESRRLEGTQTQQVVSTGQPLVRYDIAADRRFSDDEDHLRLGLRSSIALPLITKGRVIGTMGLRSCRVGTYGDEEEAILEKLASLIAPAVENATLYQRLQERTQEMALVDQVARIITSTLDIDQVYEKFAQEMKKLVDCDRLVINVVDDAHRNYTIKYAAGLDLPGSVVGEPVPLEGRQTQEVVTSGQTLVRSNLGSNPHFTADLELIKAGLKSSIVIPLNSKGRVIGSLIANSRRTSAFGPREQAILERLANQIAPAVENAELYHQVQVATEEMALVDEVARIITSTLDIGEVYDQFASEMMKLLDFDRLIINTLDPDAGTYTLRYIYGRPRPGRSIGIVTNVAGSQHEEIVKTGCTLIRDDFAADPMFPSDREAAELGLRASIMVPLIVKGRIIGTIGLRSKKVGAFGPREQAILERLAKQIAPAVENADLYQRFQERTQEIQLVDQVARIITSTLDIDQVYDRFSSEMKKLVDFDRAFLNLVDHESETYTIKYVAGIYQADRIPGVVKPLEGSLIGHVVKSGRTLCRSDVSQQLMFESDQDQLKWGARSCIAVPLFSKGRAIGMLGLRSRRVGAYGPREQAILERLAGQIAPAVENAELYQQRRQAEETERLRTQEMEALYGIASTLVQPKTFEQKCEVILDLVARAADADSVFIRVAAEDGQSLHMVAEINPGQLPSRPTTTLRLGEGLAGIVLKEGRPVVSREHQLGGPGTERGRERGVRSSVALPVKTGEELLGVINVVSRKPDHFTPERLRLLSAIADGLGMLLVNSRLSQDLQATTGEMQVADEMAQIITSTLNIDEVYEKFAQELQKHVGFDRMNINLIDSDSRTFTIKYQVGEAEEGYRVGNVLPLRGTQSHQVMTTSQTFVRDDIRDDLSFPADPKMVELGLRSNIVVPLIAKGRVIASLSLRSKDVGAYGNREKVILERLAKQIAPAIENAELYDEATSEKELATTTLAQLKAVLSGVDSGLLFVDNDRCTLWANDRYGELFGVDDLEAFTTTHRRQADRREVLRQAFADPEKAFAERMRIYAEPTFAGPTEEIELVYPVHRILQPFTTPVHDEYGESLGRLWVYHDITESKAAEEQLLQFQKMESIGRLAGGIAHDFNNLLTAIMGYSQLAMMEAPSNSLLCDHVEEIQRAAERAANLTSQLLAFSRRQVVAPKVMNLNNLILDLDRLLRRLIGEDIELVTLPSPDVGPVKVDPSQMEQVLVNLVVNARDAMPGGGKLVIETSMVDLGTQFAQQHFGTAPGSYVMLSVTDTGVGMTEEVKAHLFEPFFTTKEVGKGTGLGLATCYGIVKQGGGYIEAQSAPGQGTSFRVYLPCCEEASPEHPNYEEPTPSTGGTERVLLVEDDPLVRSMVANVLVDQGYTVLQASNGDEALRLAQEQGPRKIDLLFSDIVMPQMGGVELARRIGQLRPDTKIILTSGYSDEPIFRNGTPDSKIAFIQKPFIPAALASKVRDVLDRGE